METLDDDAGKTGQKITKKRVASALIKAGNIKSMSDPNPVRFRGPRPPPVLTYADRDRLAAMSALPHSSQSSKAAVVGGDRAESDDSDSVFGRGPSRPAGKSTGGAVAASSGSSHGRSSSQGRSASNGGSSHGKAPYSSHGRSSSGDRPSSSSDGQSRPRPPLPRGPSAGGHTETGKRRRTEDAASNDSASRPRPPPPRPRTPHSGSSKPRPPSTPKPRPPSTPKPPGGGGSTPGELFTRNEERHEASLDHVHIHTSWYTSTLILFVPFRLLFC